MTIGHFLGGVGALIQDSHTQRYLLLRRSNHRDFQAGSWECVTGRVEQGESYEEALHREVLEETGLEVQLDFLIGTTHFYRGASTPENELLGILYHCTMNHEADIHIQGEHSEWRWVSSAEARTMFDPSHWLNKTIQRAEFINNSLPDELVDYYRGIGFEI